MFLLKYVFFVFIYNYENSFYITNEHTINKKRRKKKEEKGKGEYKVKHNIKSRIRHFNYWCIVYI